MPNGDGSTNAPDAMSLYEPLGSFIGSAEHLPRDAARNVDHYLYEQPKE